MFTNQQQFSLSINNVCPCDHSHQNTLKTISEIKMERFFQWHWDCNPAAIMNLHRTMREAMLKCLAIRLRLGKVGEAIFLN